MHGRDAGHLPIVLGDIGFAVTVRAKVYEATRDSGWGRRVAKLAEEGGYRVGIGVAGGPDHRGASRGGGVTGVGLGANDHA
jgi:hypothetical protein